MQGLLHSVWVMHIRYNNIGLDLFVTMVIKLHKYQFLVEAVHLANLLCQFGYYFPVNELKNLLVKDDSSLYRFQVSSADSVLMVVNETSTFNTFGFVRIVFYVACRCKI